MTEADQPGGGTLTGDIADGGGRPLTEHVEQLDVLGGHLASAPRDRDPLIWAAHESTRCARALLQARIATTASGQRTNYDLDEAMASVRSAVIAVRHAIIDPHRTTEGDS